MLGSAFSMVNTPVHSGGPSCDEPVCPASSVPRSSWRSCSRRSPLAAPAATPDLAAIKLGCGLVVPNPLSPIAPNRAIVCRWSAPEGVTVTTYRLWRSVDAGSRHLLATIPGDGTLRFADRNIRTGHAYHYLVAGIGADGTRVAKSAVVTVRVPRAPQPLAFNCVVVDRRRRHLCAMPLVGHDASGRRALRPVAVGRRRRPRGDLPGRRGRTALVTSIMM